MRMLLTVPAVLLVATACRRPEVEAFQHHPVPVVVQFQAPGEAGEARKVEQEYAAALRQRLAQRIPTMREGQTAPEAHAVLDVRILSRKDRPDQPHAGAVGIVTGLAVATIGTALGDRDAFADGIWFGTWAGVNQAAANAEQRRWLGAVRPNFITAEVTLRQAGIQEPLWEFTVRPEEVLRAMDPLRPSQMEDRDRLREEEARAFARVVVSRLGDKFQWTIQTRPLWVPPPAPLREEDPPNIQHPEPPPQAPPVTKP